MPAKPYTTEDAYAEGLEKGRAVMAGRVGATRQCAEAGGAYVEMAASIAEKIGHPTEEIVHRIAMFHAERIEAVPDLTRYPELRDEAELLRARYRGMADGGMSDALIGLVESIHFWRAYRLPIELGVTQFGIPADRAGLVERCRVVYMPDSDHGPLHMKNVDDPLVSWTPDPPVVAPGMWPHVPLFFDGVGNGLHLDEIPPEIFPADAVAMCKRLCTTVAEAEEFLTRYNYFWGSANLLVHDEDGNSVAIDKASRCRYAVRKPDASGMSYINGMSSFDGDYEAFIEGQRKRYLDLTGQGEGTIEERYYHKSQRVLANMKDAIEGITDEPTLVNLIMQMTRHDSDGPLCKTGKPFHPDDTLLEATLAQRVYFPKTHVLWRRQWRNDVPVWEDPWEIIQYT